MRSLLFLSVITILAASATAVSPPPLAFDIALETGGVDMAEGVALASDGSVYLAGTVQRQQGEDIAIVKLDPSGKLAWTRIIDQGPTDRGADVVAMPDGGVVAAGTTTTPSTGVNIVLQKYDGSGLPSWSRVFDKGTAETARALAIDPAGNIYLTGASLGSNGGDCFLAKFSPSGEELWAKPVNLFWLDECFDVAVDAQGGAAVAGRVVRDSSFDLLVRRFSPSGDTLWTGMIATPSREEGRGVAIDPAGNVYVSGTTGVFRDGAGQSDILVGKFGPDGKHLWTKTFDVSEEDDEGRNLAFAAGGLYVTGFGRNDGEKQSILLRLTDAGDEVWRWVSTRAGTDGIGSIAVAPDGSRLVVAGATEDGPGDFDMLAVSMTPGRPAAGFRVAGVGLPTAGAPVRFEDASVAGTGGIKSRVWDFGDGHTSEEDDPSHTYATSGEYRVRLTVWDDWHTSHSEERLVRVAAPALVPAASVDSPPVGAAPEGSENAPAGGKGLGAALAVGVIAALGALAVGGWYVWKRR